MWTDPRLTPWATIMPPLRAAREHDAQAQSSARSEIAIAHSVSYGSLGGADHQGLQVVLDMLSPPTLPYAIDGPSGAQRLDYAQNALKRPFAGRNSDIGTWPPRNPLYTNDLHLLTVPGTGRRCNLWSTNGLRRRLSFALPKSRILAYNSARRSRLAAADTDGESRCDKAPLDICDARSQCGWPRSPR